MSNVLNGEHIFFFKKAIISKTTQYFKNQETIPILALNNQ